MRGCINPVITPNIHLWGLWNLSCFGSTETAVDETFKRPLGCCFGHCPLGDTHVPSWGKPINTFRTPDRPLKHHHSFLLYWIIPYQLSNWWEPLERTFIRKPSMQEYCIIIYWLQPTEGEKIYKTSCDSQIASPGKAPARVTIRFSLTVQMGLQQIQTKYSEYNKTPDSQ